ncbi:hypothetical protein L7F22_025007 [Adiantum nelumboides]|nr:hypothetical protein [Adiantum nelumboides]
MEGQKGNKKRKQVDLSSFYQIVENRTKKEDKELRKQQNTLIEGLFGEGPEIGVDDDGIEDVQDVSDEGSSQATSKPKKPRKWRPSWKYVHPWAYPVIFEGKAASKGDNHVAFVKLIKTDDGGAEENYAALIQLLKDMGLCLQKMVSLADHVNIASISGYAYATLQNLNKKFLRDSAGCGTKYLQLFVKKTNHKEITFVDAGGEMHTHTLKSDSIEESTRGGCFEDCMQLGKELVVKIVENLNSRIEDNVPIFYACKLFSPKHYPREELECKAPSKKWLLTILQQYGRLVDNTKKCMGEMDSFTSVLSSNFKHKGFCDAWAVCKADIIMRDSFPNLMKLWEILSVIPVNTAAVERGFSLQNHIKAAHRLSMSVTTLENYMFVNLNGPAATSDVPWDEVFSLWRTKKDRFINMSA